MLRRELTGGVEGALLVGVGRLAVEKRWDVVVEAYARIRARRRAVLVLFGDGPERSRLLRLARGQVRFLGFESDRGKLARSLACADVLVHGCPCETYGLSVAEAVACGLPVVIPDEGGASQPADPRCCETYRSGDPGSCATAVERLLDRRNPELRTRALEAAARVTTQGQHIEQVLSVYRDLLGDS